MYVVSNVVGTYVGNTVGRIYILFSLCIYNTCVHTLQWVLALLLRKKTQIPGLYIYSFGNVIGEYRRDRRKIIKIIIIKKENGSCDFVPSRFKRNDVCKCFMNATAFVRKKIDNSVSEKCALQFSLLSVGWQYVQFSIISLLRTIIYWYLIVSLDLN